MSLFTSADTNLCCSDTSPSTTLAVSADIGCDEAREVLHNENDEPVTILVVEGC